MADRASELRSTGIAQIGAGTSVLVAGEVGYCVSVVALILSATAATQITLQDAHVSLLDLYLAQNGPVVVPVADGNWIVGTSGDALSIVNVTGGNVAGRIVYRMVPDHQRY
jgi:hypothetical protein